MSGGAKPSKVEKSTPANTINPVGPYSHIAKVGQFTTIGGTEGIEPATRDLAGPDIESQPKQIIDAFEVVHQLEIILRFSNRQQYRLFF